MDSPLNKAQLDKVDFVRNYGGGVESFALSIIVVTYDANYDLIECLDSLQNQSFQDFETIVVDNGRNEKVVGQLRNYGVKYVRLNDNYGPSIARNVGICYARSEIICFLDDDAVGDADLVKMHLTAHQEYDIVGLRGRVLPKTGVIYNDLQSHYDLGEEVRPSYINVEGNSSFLKEPLVKVGGFNPEMFIFYEGPELSYRLYKECGDKDKMIYYPRAIIYHDYAATLVDYLNKRRKLAKMRGRLAREHPEILAFMEGYRFERGGKERKERPLLHKVKLNLIKGLAFSYLKVRGYDNLV